METSTSAPQDAAMQTTAATTEAPKATSEFVDIAAHETFVQTFQNRLHPADANKLAQSGLRFGAVMDRFTKPAEPSKSPLLEKATKLHEKTATDQSRKYDRVLATQNPLGLKYPETDPAVHEVAAALLGSLHIQGKTELAGLISSPEAVAKKIVTEAIRHMQQGATAEAKATTQRLLQQRSAQFSASLSVTVADALVLGGKEGASLLKDALQKTTQSLETVVSSRSDTKRGLGKLLIGRSKPEGYPTEPESGAGMALHTLDASINHAELVAGRTSLGYVEKQIQAYAAETGVNVEDYLQSVSKSYHSQVAKLGSNEQLLTAVMNHLQTVGFNVIRKGQENANTTTGSNAGNVQTGTKEALGFSPEVVERVQAMLAQSMQQTEGATKEAALWKIMLQNHPDRNPSPDAKEVFQYAKSLRENLQS